MKEEIVKYETAKLAKEKGFPQNLGNYHYDHVFDNKLTYGRATEQRFQADMTAAPTQSLLQKWLREKHNIFVCPMWYGGLVYPRVCFNCTIKGRGAQNKLTPVMDSYEEALEYGLIEALKLI